MVWTMEDSALAYLVRLIRGDRVEKYRPVNLDDVVSHKDIITTSQ